MGRSGPYSFTWGSYTWHGKYFHILVRNVLTWLVTNNRIQDNKVPWTPPRSPIRWFIVRGEPIHKSGGRFITPVTVGDFTIEAHVETIPGIERLRGLFEYLGIECV